MAADTTPGDATKKSRSRIQMTRPTTLAFGTGLSVPYLEHKSSSEPELNSSFKSKQEQYWSTFNRGFPPGVTVDELSHYRRRRLPGNLRPQDNLHPESGSLKSIKSEYKRRFLPHESRFSEEKENSKVIQGRRRRPDDCLRLEGEAYFRPEYYETFVDFPRERPNPRRPKPQLTTAEENVHMERLTEKTAKFVPHPFVKRPPLARKPTSLKSEGELFVKESEIHSKFIKFDTFKRSELARRPTNLKMEGEIDLLTEKLEKFVKYESPERPKPIRRSSNLRLEGVMEKLTEIREKYTRFLSPKRAELKRRPTSLHMEGEHEKSTEIREKFVEFRGVKRPDPIIKPPNLHLDGDLEFLPEYKDFFIDFPRARPIIKRPIESLKSEGEFQSMTEKRAQYVEYLLSQYGRPDMARKPPESLKLEGQFEPNPEYRESYVNFPLERSKAIRHESNLKTGVNLYENQNSNNFLGDKSVIKPSDSEPEKSSDYKLPIKRLKGPGKPLPNNFRLPDRTEIKQEYRSSCLDIPRRARNRSSVRRYQDQDNSFSDGELIKKSSKRSVFQRSASKKRFDDPWKGGDSLHSTLRPTTTIPGSPERAAFRILERTTKGERGEKVVSFDTTESSNRRQSDSSDTQSKIRTSSPSYRLLVDPVDIRNNVADRNYVKSSYNPSPIIQKSYLSPLPAVEYHKNYENFVKSENIANESFIVLDDLNNNDLMQSKNRINQKCLSPVSRSDFIDVPRRPRDTAIKTTDHNINWMPPWYDAPTSI